MYVVTELPGIEVVEYIVVRGVRGGGAGLEQVVQQLLRLRGGRSLRGPSDTGAAS